MRKEHDSLGCMDIADEHYYGIQTERNRQAFDIGSLTLQDFPPFIDAVVHIKIACARANLEIGALDEEKAKAIEKAGWEMKNHEFDFTLPVNIFRGSGTPLNAGVNEIIAHRANEILTGNKTGEVHPSTHVNMAQSSNDVIPTAKTLVVYDQLTLIIEATKELIRVLKQKGSEFSTVIKMGRTGIQDAVPITLGQQFNAFAHGIERSLNRLEFEQKHWNHSCLGGTAVGTGMGCLPGFRQKINKHLSDVLGRPIESYGDLVDGMMALDDLIACHGQVVALSSQLWKFARDLRLMASGPNSGLREISLKSPDQKQKNYPQRYAYNGLESVIAACNQVSANNTALLYGLKNGWLDLGACSSIPLRSMINSRELMVDAMKMLSEEILPRIEVNTELCRHMAESSASNSTMISTVLGYEAGTRVAKLAIEKNISCKEAAKQLQVLPDSVLDELFDVVNLTDPGSMEALFEKYKSYRSV